MKHGSLEYIRISNNISIDKKQTLDAIVLLKTQHDVDIPRVTQDQVSGTQAQVIQGPITRSHAKKLQQEVNSFIAKINFKIYENVILPKSCTLVVLRNIHEEDGTNKHGEEVNNKKQSDRSNQGSWRIPSNSVRTIVQTKNHPF
jgi:hypothetical protein